MHLILHTCDVWIVVVNLVTMNYWVADLVTDPYGQGLPEESIIEQLSKSHVVRGNVNN